MNRWEKASFYQWFNKFSKESKQLEDESRSGAPKSARKEKNIQKAQKLMMQDRQMSARMLSEVVDVGIGIVNTILSEDLELHKICAKFLPKKRTLQWKNGQWWFHQDNAPCHKSTLVITWMADRGIKTVLHPPYSPNLAPCDFCLFPCMKENLERIRFHSAEKLKKSSENCLMGSLMKDFEKIFQNRERHMKTCVDAGGSNFEGDQVLWAYGNKWCFSWNFLITYWTYLVYLIVSA